MDFGSGIYQTDHHSSLMVGVENNGMIAYDLKTKQHMQMFRRWILIGSTFERLRWKFGQSVYHATPRVDN